MTWQLQTLLLETDLFRLPAPLSVLTDLLAQTLVADFDEHVLVVRLRLGSAERLAETVPHRSRQDGVWRCLIEADSLTRLVADLRRAVAVAGAMLAGEAGVRDAIYVLLDTSELTPTIPRPVLLAHLGPLLRRVVYLTRDPSAPLPAPFEALGEVSILHTLLLGGAPRARLIEENVVRLRLEAEELTPAALPPAEGRLVELGKHARRNFSRWARALTERRIGLALGGGGAYGYAHVELLRQLSVDDPVPIDTVSGASFGALVGAYFCARGLEGLEQVVEDRREIRRATRLACLSSSALSRLVDRALGRVLLQDLETPLLAVTANLLDGSAVVPTSGTLGEAVRMSASFPGLFAPTTTADGRFVDGAVVNNVPDTLFLKGYGLVIASNIVPRPPEKARSRLPRTRLGHWFHEFEPWHRLRDTVHACFLLMYSAGEHGFADVAFAPNLVGYHFWDFEKAYSIMREARPSAQRAAERIRTLWRALRST